MKEPEFKRYPGTRAFDDTPDYRRLFTGRDDEILQLCQRIASHRVIVLYAASGTGKSSLLRAGVFPVLRSQGYLPLNVRFSADTDKPLLVQLHDEVREEALRECQNADIVNAPGEPSSFLHYFQETEFWGEDGVMAPVLVLDQFEEVFYLHDAARRMEIFRQLAALVRGRADADQPGGPATSTARLRLVLSLREDAVGQLAAMGAEIPGLMDHAFRLLPLGEEAAARAIKIPAENTELPHAYTPPFKCDPPAVQDLVSWLAEKSGVEIESIAGKTTRSVEPFVLQIFCQHIEEAIISQRREGVTNAEFTTNLLATDAAKEKVLRGYYLGKLAQFVLTKPEVENPKDDPRLAALAREMFAPARVEKEGNRIHAWLKAVGEGMRRGSLIYSVGQNLWLTRRGWGALRLLEESLLTSDGRRQPRDRDAIMKARGLNSKDIALLEDLRLVRTEPHGGAKLLNLSHDQLAVAIHRHSQLRAIKRFSRVCAVLGVFLLISGLSRWWIVQERRSTEDAKAAAAREKKNANELRSMRKQAAKLARDQARNAEDETEAFSALALAVKTDPEDEGAFHKLLTDSLSWNTALPRRWLQSGSGLDGSALRIVAADPDGRHFAALPSNAIDEVQSFDASDPLKERRKFRLPSAPDARKPVIALGREGQRLAAVLPGRSSSGMGRSATIVVLDSSDSAVRQPVPLTTYPHEILLRMSPKGSWLQARPGGKDALSLLVALDTGTVFISPETGSSKSDPRQSVPGEVTAYGAFFRSVAFHPLDETMAVTDADGKCWMWLTPENQWKMIEPGPCHTVSFSPDGKWLTCSGFNDAKITATDPLLKSQPPDWANIAPPVTGKPLATRAGMVSFSSDGRTVFAGLHSSVSSPVDYGQSSRRRTTTRVEAVLSSLSGASDSAKWLPVSPASVSRFSSNVSSLARTYPGQSVDQQATPDLTPRQLGGSGRWLLSGNLVSDLTNAIHAESLPSNQDDSRSESEPSEAAGNWTVMEELSDQPLIRRVNADATVSEWSVRPVRRLRPAWISVGGTGRLAALSSEGTWVISWDQNKQSVSVWELTAGPSEAKTVQLGDRWRPVNVSAGRWLTVSREASKAPDAPEIPEVAVWDLQSNKERSWLPLPEGTSVPTLSTSMGVSDDGRHLACLMEKPGGIVLELHTANLDEGSGSPAWNNRGSGVADFTHNLFFILGNPDDEACVRVGPVFDSREGTPLPSLTGAVQQPVVSVRSDGQRLVCFYADATNPLRAASYSRTAQGWSKEWEVPLPGPSDGHADAVAATDEICISDDWRWIAAYSDGQVRAWELTGSSTSPVAVALPAIPWDEDVYEYEDSELPPPRIAFFPDSHELALNLNGRIGIVHVAPWRFATSTEERQAFAELVLALTSRSRLAQAMPGGVANPAPKQEGFIVPADALWNRFCEHSPSDSALRRIVEWLLEREGTGRPHPFSNQTAADLRKAVLETPTLAGVREVLHSSPDDPEALAAYGMALTQTRSVPFAPVMAAFHHAIRHAGSLPEKSLLHIRSMEVEAMTHVAEAMLGSGNHSKALEAVARGEAAAKVAGLPADSEWRTRLSAARRKAETPAPNEPGLPEPTTQSE